MVSLLPLNVGGYDLVPLDSAAGKDRPIPLDWLDAGDLGVSQHFISYVRPLDGELLAYSAPLSITAPEASTDIQTESLNRV